jgi:hypothetical protein
VGRRKEYVCPWASQCPLVISATPAMRGNPCYAPQAGYSHGVCVENGHLLIALVILILCFWPSSRVVL